MVLGYSAPNVDRAFESRIFRARCALWKPTPGCWPGQIMLFSQREPTAQICSAKYFCLCHNSASAFVWPHGCKVHHSMRISDRAETVASVRVCCPFQRSRGCVWYYMIDTRCTTECASAMARWWKPPPPPTAISQVRLSEGEQTKKNTRLEVLQLQAQLFVCLHTCLHGGDSLQLFNTPEWTPCCQQNKSHQMTN